MSTGTPSAEVQVHTRPPTRSRASKTATDWPAWDKRRAAVSPANPAPTAQTSGSIARPAMRRTSRAGKEANMRAARM